MAGFAHNCCAVCFVIVATPSGDGIAGLGERGEPVLLGHTKLESTVRYLGIEVDDALEIAEQMDV